VPWGLCGVFFTGVLGVNTIEYLPYAFLSYITPVVAIIYAYTGKFIWKEEITGTAIDVKRENTADGAK
jgi:NhaC family Na+:H+ antiporter